MPPQITCASALPGKTGKHKNCIFHSNVVLVQQSLLDFFNLFESRLMLTLLYDSLNLVINALARGCWGAWFRINEVESAAEVGLCCTHNAAVRCLLGNAEALDR